MLLLFKKHTDKLIEQTKTKPQGTLEFKMIRLKQIISFNPPMNLLEQGNCLLGLSSLDCTNSVFSISDENNSFSINIPGHWEIEFHRKTFAKIDELIQLRSLELHVKEARKRGNKVKIGDNEYKLSDHDTQRNVILE